MEVTGETFSFLQKEKKSRRGKMPKALKLSGKENRGTVLCLTIPHWQYNRKGHLFQDRYKSEPVEEDAYFLTVLRYIHQNPVKAGLINDIASYKWSSYNEYINQPKIVNIEFALKMFHQERDKAIERFERFNQETNNDQCIEMPTKRETLSDKEINHLVLSKYQIELVTLQNAPTIIQDKVLKYLKGLDGCSLRQVSRLTGFTVNKIFKV